MKKKKINTKEYKELGFTVIKNIVPKKNLTQKNYEKITRHVYENLSWGPLFRKKDGAKIINTDNDSSAYIKESLKKMNIKVSQLKNMNVFNIGTGRESRFFASKNANVTHVDISKENVQSLNKWAKINGKNVKSISGNIEKINLGENKFDIIFLAGIYQHLLNPAYCLSKFINALKTNGKMYMGFYRSGEFKYFIVDAIRYILGSRNNLNELKKISKQVQLYNSIIHTLGNKNKYQNSRVLDDFFVPRKHNFHPKDIIHDIKILGGAISHFDNDFRKYNHETKQYFSIGGDRIYITKKISKNIRLNNVKNYLKTINGKDQILDMKYNEKIINENIELIKKIKRKLVKKQDLKVLISLSMYQFTRPFNQDESQIYQETLRNGRHKTLNSFLKNCISLI